MIIEQHPYIDEQGTEFPNLIKHSSDDETKNILQNETGIVFEEAIDLYPCRYTYSEVDKPEPEVEENDH